MSFDLFLRDILIADSRPEELTVIFEKFFNCLFKSSNIISESDYVCVKLIRQNHNSKYMYGFMKLESKKNYVLLDFFEQHKLYFRKQEIFVRENDQESRYINNSNSNCNLLDYKDLFTIEKIIKIEKYNFKKMFEYIESNEPNVGNKFENYSLKRPVIKIPFELDEMDQLMKPTVEECYPSESIKILKEVYQEELNKIKIRQDQLSDLLRGIEEMELEIDRLKSIEVNFIIREQKLLKTKSEVDHLIDLISCKK